MTLHFGRKFWRFLTTVVVLFMLFVVGRNLVHAVKSRGKSGRCGVRPRSIARK